MTRQRLILIAGLGSAALLLGAWGFQALGYAPCKICLWQRWPHGVAVLISVAALAVPSPMLPLLGALASATTGSIGIYHTGIEQHWWPGPDTCTSGDIGGLTSEQLLQQILAAPLIRCDEVAWQFIGLSMASWNAVLSFSLMALWLAAWRH